MCQWVSSIYVKVTSTVYIAYSLWPEIIKLSLSISIVCIWVIIPLLPEFTLHDNYLVSDHLCRSLFECSISQTVPAFSAQRCRATADTEKQRETISATGQLGLTANKFLMLEEIVDSEDIINKLKKTWVIFSFFSTHLIKPSSLKASSLRPLLSAAMIHWTKTKKKMAVWLNSPIQ